MLFGAQPWNSKRSNAFYFIFYFFWFVFICLSGPHKAAYTTEIWDKDPSRPTLPHNPAFPGGGTLARPQGLFQKGTQRGEREPRGYPTTKPHSHVGLWNVLVAV